MEKITPFMWFKDNAEEAVQFYLGIFKDSKILKKAYYTGAGKEHHGMDAGTVLTIDFELEGQRFVALNGGPTFTFNPAISFVVNVESQKELDYYWNHLTKDGEPRAQQCGWLQDKFGVSWQIVPTQIKMMMTDSDPTKVNRLMTALLPMKKLDLDLLVKAFHGE
ncbi:VOC family protein [Leptospira sp. 96542]|nr:VOC family protein [Leptospira sp. 96542]